MNGVLVADKPAGWTSHDVVSAVKKRLGAKKVGHLGTLDPMATGVLPLVVNKATRYARFLDGGKKVYLATMELGVETDTYDIEGTVVAASEVTATEEDVLRVMAEFTGTLRQVPPMYSARKVKGVPLYKLARKGVVVEREAREIEIFSNEVLGVKLPLVTFVVSCSRGTYVRSICHDVGVALGCGARLTALRRTACGEFTEAEAIGPDSPPDELAAAIIPLEEALKRCGAEGAVL